MFFKKSRPLLLVGAALFASAIAASSASAQNANSHAAADCVLGAGTDCEDTFGASSVAKQAAPSRASASTAKYDAYVAYKEKQQVGLARALEKAAENGRQAILRRCEAVSPNQPTDVCP
jgi:hypothetical protein